jgi:7,8-dihydropterin-6-yl-methyl-4-(beta-D-ribofuranosyl)aminobenzene 5'-phosphate synthase
MTTARTYILSDNTPIRRGFGSEHGLSILIRMDPDSYWLWDTGQSSLFLESAQKLGLDLEKLKGVALSHGHYDHTDGLSMLLNEIDFKGPIYAHPDFAVERFKIQKGSVPKPIGLNKDTLPWPLPGFVGVSGSLELTRGLTMISKIERRPGLYQSASDFYFDAEKHRPDFVADDACLVLLSNPGPAVILGCCHSGLANTLYQVKDILGLNRVFAIIGGMHLINASESSWHQTVQVLREFSVEQIYPCHCTGRKSIDFLKEQLPGKVFDIGTGSVIEPV